MNKILIAAATLAAFATTSYAADLPARMPVKAMPAPVVQSWTGCYIGAGGGYGMWNQGSSHQRCRRLAPWSVSADDHWRPRLVRHGAGRL